MIEIIAFAAAFFSLGLSVAALVIALFLWRKLDGSPRPASLENALRSPSSRPVLGRGLSESLGPDGPFGASSEAIRRRIRSGLGGQSSSSSNDDAQQP